MKRLLLAPFLLFLLTSCADNLYKAKHICGKVGVEITYKKAMKLLKITNKSAFDKGEAYSTDYERVEAYCKYFE